MFFVDAIVWSAMNMLSMCLFKFKDELTKLLLHKPVTNFSSNVVKTLFICSIWNQLIYFSAKKQIKLYEETNRCVSLARLVDAFVETSFLLTFFYEALLNVGAGSTARWLNKAAPPSFAIVGILGATWSSMSNASFKEVSKLIFWEPNVIVWRGQRASRPFRHGHRKGGPWFPIGFWKLQQ